MIRPGLPFVMFLTACAGAAPTDDSAEASDTGVDEARFAVGGRIADLGGEPVVDVFVTVSTEFCIPDRTDDDGAVEVTKVSPGAKRLSTYGETAVDGLFASVVFAFDADETTVFADPVLAPALTEVHPVDPNAAEEQVIESIDGLSLTVPAGSLA